MRVTIVMFSLCLGLTSGAWAADEIKDYTGHFTTQILYTMCSQNNPTARGKCDMYIQGLIYGLKTQQSMQEQGMPVCLPAMTTESARLKILEFIDGTTGGKPGTNADGGDWMAFMGLSAGNLCKK